MVFVGYYFENFGGFLVQFLQIFIFGGYYLGFFFYFYLEYDFDIVTFYIIYN